MDESVSRSERRRELGIGGAGVLDSYIDCGRVDRAGLDAGPGVLVLFGDHPRAVVMLDTLGGDELEPALGGLACGDGAICLQPQ